MLPAVIHTMIGMVAFFCGLTMGYLIWGRYKVLYNNLCDWLAIKTNEEDVDEEAPNMYDVV